MTPLDKAQAFAALHRRGDPLVLFNVWDAGSAKAVAEAGAKAIATGSASVAAANGFGDAEALPLDLALANAERVVRAVPLPVTIDFEGAYVAEPEGAARNMVGLAATGAVGCNFEDQVIGGEGLHPVDLQAARIRSAREAVGPHFFLNARTDIFLKAPRDAHNRAKVEEALERARAYAEAGASGIFPAGLVDIDLLAAFCAASPLPVNALPLPSGPSAADLARAGVARISHGPFPYLALMKTLGERAREVHA